MPLYGLQTPTSKVHVIHEQGGKHRPKNMYTNWSMVGSGERINISSTGRGVGHAKTNQFREQFAAKTLPHCTSAHQAVLSRRNQLLACIEGATTMVRDIFLPGSFRWGVDHIYVG